MAYTVTTGYTPPPATPYVSNTRAHRSTATDRGNSWYLVDARALKVQRNQWPATMQLVLDNAAHTCRYVGADETGAAYLSAAGHTVVVANDMGLLTLQAMRDAAALGPVAARCLAVTATA